MLRSDMIEVFHTIPVRIERRPFGQLRTGQYWVEKGMYDLFLGAAVNRSDMSALEGQICQWLIMDYCGTRAL